MDFDGRRKRSGGKLTDPLLDGSESAKLVGVESPRNGSMICGECTIDGDAMHAVLVLVGAKSMCPV